MEDHQSVHNAQTSAAIAKVRPELEQIDWGEHGLTRQDLQDRLPDFPHVLYLHLPASKRFRNAAELIHAIDVDFDRAEGEFFDSAEAATLPDEREVREDGGPPAWGQDPLLAGGSEASGSATDTEGLDASLDENSQLDNE